jgi:AcrR family transcriptional regulator
MAESDGDIRDQLVDAGLRVLDQAGPSELTVRRIAETAGTSTMGVYSRFGSRSGVLNSIYERGFALLIEELTALPDTGDARQRVLDLSLVCRRFALARPALYAFMFERPVPDFDPGPQRRDAMLRASFGLLVAAVQRAIAQGTLAPGDPVRTSYLVWSMTHGMISLELTYVRRGPLPGWLIESPAAAERVFVDGLLAVLAGLQARSTPA